MRYEVIDWNGLEPDQTSLAAASDANEHFWVRREVRLVGPGRKRRAYSPQSSSVRRRRDLPMFPCFSWNTHGLSRISCTTSAFADLKRRKPHVESCLGIPDRYPVGREAESIMAEPVGSDLPASHSILLAGRTTLRAVPPHAPESGLSLRFEMKRGASVRPERLGGSNRGYAIRELNVVQRRRAV